MSLRTNYQFASVLAGLLMGGLLGGLAIAQEPAAESPQPVPATQQEETSPQIPPANEEQAPEQPVLVPATPTQTQPPDRDAPAATAPRDRSNTTHDARDRNPSSPAREAQPADTRRPTDAQQIDAESHRTSGDDRDRDPARNNFRRQGTDRYNTSNLGLAFDTTVARGLVINDIGSTGYFRDANFRRGDQIVSAGGRRFNDQAGFYGWLATVQPGQRVPFVILRDGQEATVHWTPTAEFVREYTQVVPGEAIVYQGIRVDDTVQDAVVVADVDHGSPAEMAGVTPNDVILAVNNEEVRTPREFLETTSRLPQGQIADLSISRTVVVQIDPAAQRRAPEQQRTSLPPSPDTSALPPNVPPPVVTPAPYRPTPAPVRRGVGRIFRNR